MGFGIHSGTDLLYDAGAGWYLDARHNRTRIAAHTACRLSAAASVHNGDNWDRDAEERYFLTYKAQILER